MQSPVHMHFALTLLVWIVLALVSLVALKIALHFLAIGIHIAIGIAVAIAAHIAYLRTRKVRPEQGQRWRQGDKVVEITRVYDDGSLYLSCGCASWCETIGNWRKRVAGRKLYLIS